MRTITDKKFAEFAAKPVGSIVFDEEFDRLQAAYHAAIEDADEARYRLAKEGRGGRVVTDTWQHGGMSFRRGEIVYVTAVGNSHGHWLVQRGKSRQTRVFTATWPEIAAHTEARGTDGMEG